MGGSTNAQPHLMAMAKHAGVELEPEDWQVHGYDIPLLADVQPAGRFLGERFHRAGGVPAIMRELLDAGKLDGDCPTVTGRSMAENLEGRGPATARSSALWRTAEGAGGLPRPEGQSLRLRHHEDLGHLAGIPRALPERAGPRGHLRGRAVVFDGSEDYHRRINDPALGIDERTILVIRGAGPLGWPGSAEVVNMQPPDHLLKRGITSLPTIGDGRQSGTADSPSILNASPESAAGGGLAFLRTGDVIRIDLTQGRCDMLVEAAEIERRKADGIPPVPADATPWQRIYRRTVTQLSDGAVIDGAADFRGIAETPPRHNH
nr:dihydroxy-acid dehydratase [Shinella sp. HZN7]